MGLLGRKVRGGIYEGQMKKMAYQCCVCRKMRGAGGKYYRVIMNEIPGTVVSHGFCPECLAKHFKTKMVQNAGNC